MPKIVDHEALRTAVLDASFELFARRGYHAVGMRDIASEMDVSTGTLYHYFSSKEEIFQTMLRHLSHADVIDAIGGILPGSGTQERLEVLYRFVEAREKYFQNLIFVIVDSLRENNAALRRSVQETLAVYREAIRDHVGVEEQEAAQIMSLVIGTVFQRLADPRSVQLPGRSPAKRREHTGEKT